MEIFSEPDDRIATIYETVLSLVYIRYIKKNGDRRGEPKFEFFELMPSCGALDNTPGPGLPPRALERERINPGQTDMQSCSTILECPVIVIYAPERHQRLPRRDICLPADPFPETTFNEHRKITIVIESWLRTASQADFPDRFLVAELRPEARAYLLQNSEALIHHAQFRSHKYNTLIHSNLFP
jgi:hypothetical protein